MRLDLNIRVPLLSAVPAAVEIVRPLNCLLAFAAVLAGGAVGAGFGALSTLSGAMPLLYAGAAAALVTGAGNVLNDVHDVRVDRKNHPERPLPSGRMGTESARALAAALFVAGIALGALAGYAPLIIAMLNALVLLLYETRLKAAGLSGNALVSYLTASLFLFGGAAAGAYLLPALLALLAFTVSMGREIVKDIEDMAGDVGRRTLPMRVGRRRAGVIAGAFLIGGVALSPTPFYPFPLLGPYYLPAVAAADVLFVYAAALQFRSPARASLALKAGMAVALAAFFLGRL